MVFSDTTAKNGLIQDVEFWTKQGDGAITGNTTLLKQITSRLNQSFDRIMPFLLAYLKRNGWDDTNTTGIPTKTQNIVTTTNAYTFLVDSNALGIFVINDVAILQSASATAYAFLEKTTLEDPDADRMISPNTIDVGIPSRVLIRGNTVFFDVIPNYNATSGVKVFFSREQTRFVSTDTTKAPGIPAPFHNLLSLYTSKDWLAVNKPENTVLISEVKQEIAKREQELMSFIMAANPTHERMSAGAQNNK